MSCYRTSNNKHFTAPPRMADGRHFTDYRPSCHINNMIRNNNTITNSFEYRLFLTRNAEKLMEINNKHAFIKNGVFKCKEPYHQGTMLPELDRVVCDTDNCHIVDGDRNGIGRGREYSVQPNNLLDGIKTPELSLENNECTPPASNFNYYPDTVAQGNNVQRQAVVGGGEMLKGGDPNTYN